MFCWKNVSSFKSKKFQQICVSRDVNFNESLTNDVVSFKQLGPGVFLLVSSYNNIIVCRATFAPLAQA